MFEFISFNNAEVESYRDIILQMNSITYIIVKWNRLCKRPRLVLNNVEKYFLNSQRLFFCRYNFTIYFWKLSDGKVASRNRFRLVTHLNNTNTPKMKQPLQKTEASFKQCREIFFEFATFIFIPLQLLHYIF